MIESIIIGISIILCVLMMSVSAIIVFNDYDIQELIELLEGIVDIFKSKEKDYNTHNEVFQQYVDKIETLNEQYDNGNASVKDYEILLNQLSKYLKTHILNNQ